MSGLSVSCVVCHYVDDNLVIVFVSCPFHFSEGLGKGEGVLKDDIV